MRTSASTLLALINDILDFSKIEADRIELETTPLGIAELVESLCASKLNTARTRGVALHTFIDPDLPLRRADQVHEIRDLLVATDDSTGAVVGSLTLVVFRIPTGVRAWIEDVVVDGAARGRGVGEALNRFALDRAAALGARTVDLTSRPTREAANRLYRRLGFEPRDTNIYRYNPDADALTRDA